MRTTIGVIGHVDHGKTALVHALTGMQTDRLAEERRRGISIALGFAFLRVDDVTIDLIDMPGHERFVRTMISGASGIDAAMLVVAANEGLKPQSREHLDIAALLGIERVLIVVSKTDLVDADAARSVADSAAVLAAQTGLAVCGTVLSSAAAGFGIDALKQALAELARTPVPRADAGFPYLPIDRAFTVPGHGTVVTGTLRRGALSLDDELELMPGHRPVRLRGLQIHGRVERQAEEGQRVALNLRDFTRDQIPSGVALGRRGRLIESTWLTVRLHAVAGALALATSSRVMLLFGTEEVEARLRLLDRDQLQPGDHALAQLHTARPVAVPARERFILRRPSPPLTLAGGQVIDPAATRQRRHASAVIERLSTLIGAAPDAIIAAELSAAGPAGVTLSRLSQLAGIDQARVVALLPAIPAILGHSTAALLQTEWDRVLAAIPAAIASHPEATPALLLTLMPHSSPAVLDDALAELLRRGTLVRAGALIRLPTPQRDRERAEAEASSAARIAEILRQAGLSPPGLAEIVPDAQSRRIVDRLIRAGTVIRAVDKVHKREVLFHHDAVESAKSRLTPLLAGSGLLVGEAGAALGISRKYCVPLLEHLDAIRFTRRISDRRILAPPPLNTPAGSPPGRPDSSP